MAQIICHHKGKYNFYCTISDGFRFVSSITLEQLTSLIKEERGSNGLEQLGERLKRAQLYGTSALPSEELDSFLCCNRAGLIEEFLTTDECIKRFLS